MSFHTPEERLAAGAKPIAIPRTEAQQIIAKVAHENGLTYADILSQTRSKHIVRARYDAMAAVYIAKPHLSLAQMGKIFRRDPKTAWHGLMRRGLK
jgi:chromosomal replication initiation ATPase DnaA